MQDLLDKTVRASKTCLSGALENPKHCAVSSQGHVQAKNTRKENKGWLQACGRSFEDMVQHLSQFARQDAFGQGTISEKESQQPLVAPTLPTSPGSSSKRLSRAEAAKALDSTGGVKESGGQLWFGDCFCQPCQCAWVKLRRKNTLGRRNQSSLVSQILRPCCSCGNNVCRPLWLSVAKFSAIEAA